MAPADSERVYTGPITLTRPRLTRALEWATLAMCVAMPVLSFVFRDGGSGWFAAPLAAIAAAIMGAALAWENRRATGEIRRGRDGTLRVTRRGGRTVRLAPGALRDGVTVPREVHEEIEVALEDGRLLTLVARSVAQGRRVLSLLGVDASRHRSRIALGGNVNGRRGALVGLAGLASLSAVLAQSLPVAWPIVCAVALACLPLAAWFWRSGRRGAVALVGLDGVEVRQRGRVRFVPLAGVIRAHVRVDPTSPGVELELADWTRELLVSDPGGAQERMRALALKVIEALRARERLGLPASAPRLLERGKRSFAEWAEALRGLARTTGAYRAAAVSVEDFAAVLDDPDATAEQRIGAALVLDGTGDPAARTRLRVAADTSASPSMRVALTAIADAASEEDAIAEALAEDDAAAAPAEHESRG